MSEILIQQLQEEIIDLQGRILHQEDMLAALNQTVVDQDKHIQTLQHWMKRCQSRLDEVAYSIENNQGGNISEPPPPHY